MEAYGEKDKSREASIRRMMNACDTNPELQMQLFKAPDEVARQFNVQLTADEKTHLAKVADLYRVVEEFKAGRIGGPGPIFYPADVWWKRKIFDHVLRYRPIFYQIFYPVFYPIDLGHIDLTQRFDALRFRRR
jgi:hypothetical protein